MTISMLDQISVITKLKMLIILWLTSIRFIVFIIFFCVPRFLLVESASFLTSTGHLIWSGAFLFCFHSLTETQIYLPMPSRERSPTQTIILPGFYARLLLSNRTTRPASGALDPLDQFIDSTRPSLSNIRKWWRDNWFWREVPSTGSASLIKHLLNVLAAT